MATKKNTIKKAFTANEIYGLNQGLGWLLNVDVKNTGVPMLWDGVRASNKVKPIVEQITEVGEKVNKEFLTETDKDGNKVCPKERLDDYTLANKEIEKMTFEAEFPTFNAKDLEKLPGITGRVILQLQALINE